MNTTELTEAEETKRGTALVEMLELLPMRQTQAEIRTHGRRYRTSWGTKTALGLFRSVKRIVEDGE